MKKKNVIEIRQAFLDFFLSKGHEIMRGSSLLPEEDSSLLFTNSGMNQFKNIFLGLDTSSSRRIVTVQRCVRAGGKHNDLEHVGYDDHHLTFFEMLGNFSFGDYFKEDAIFFAWELLTSSRWFNLPKEKLLVTVHEDDKKSYDVWYNKIGIIDKRIVRVGSTKVNGRYFSDNFWQMGDLGPCGPCSEIFYDYGEDILKECFKDDVKQRYDSANHIEIWNLVFMEFNRQFDGTLLPLPMLSVDTGMGLERIASVLQSVNSSYDIDLFYHLMIRIANIIGNIDFKNSSFRVIADHIRTCSFLISDGVYPSNEGHGYVLRRIIRRAIRHGKILGIHEMFFYKLVDPVIEVMGNFNSQLVKSKKNIEDILFSEEKKFSLVLENGLEILNTELLNLNIGDILDGEKVFHFYSTYGFPVQFTKDICLKRNIKIDEIGFKRAMLIHKKSTHKSNRFMVDKNKLLLMNQNTDFVGYENLSYSSKIIALFKGNKISESLSQGELGIVILDKTPFYGESGGQIGDCGVLRTEFMFFEVSQTNRYGQVFCHWGTVITGVLNVGDCVVAEVDSEYRKCVSLNHSATHLLHSALIDILGNHVIQKGSFINHRYLRFDFLHHTPMSFDQICLVESIINEKIRNNLSISSLFLPINVALSKGAKILPGKQYNNIVRVLSIEDFSVELCGGTHAVRTGDIGLFIIFNECSIASGIRRIEGMSGMEALCFFHNQKKLIKNIECQVKSHGSNILKKVKILCNRVEGLDNELKKFKECQIFDKTTKLMEKVRYLGNVKLIVDQVNNVDLKILRVIVNNLKNKLGSGIVVIFFVNAGNLLNLVVGVTQDLIYYVNAIEIIDYLNSKIGSNGGGTPYLAQSGGGNVRFLYKSIKMLDVFLIKKFRYYVP